MSELDDGVGPEDVEAHLVDTDTGEDVDPRPWTGGHIGPTDDPGNPDEDAAAGDAGSNETTEPSEPTEPSGPAGDQDPLARVSAERDEYLDALRRMQAEFENYKKRVIRQQSEQLERAAQSLVSKLLPVLDNLDLALAHTEADSETAKALAQVGASLIDALSREGLERVEPVGGLFDPHEADAVMHEPADEDQQGPVVSEVLRAGYRWKGRVIRPAMVKVKG